ncbi:MAG: succinylglutamate desuccinylase/aspartoacylase family protein [Alphaproteobacteria bacterium]|nr:succinylglutamate desuccinylase/aspartoacylase family protein [Alphaproteobacteria bacterium]
MLYPGFDIELGADGKSIGNIWVYDVTNESAEGKTATPLVVIKNGDGPTALLLGGIHGDEYVGQLALTRLAQEIAANEINGRLIIVPAANVYASQSGTRLSPRDGKNMNGCFPGNADGSVTDKICNIIENVLIPECDFIVDLHSGGRSLEYVPAPLVPLSKDEALKGRSLDLAAAFGTEYIYVIEDVGQTTAAAAHRNNKPLIATELGGGELADPDAIDLAYSGTLKVLAKAGIIQGKEVSPSVPQQLAFGPNAFLRAPTDGVFLPKHKLGAIVHKGDVAGHLMWPHEPERLAHELVYPNDGILVCRRPINRVKKGDCILHLGIPTT